MKTSIAYFECDVKKFHTAESLWFWFITGKTIRNGFARGSGSRSICEILDVELLITRLHLAGKLTDKHLQIMVEYGRRRYAPNPNRPQERIAASEWSAAMSILLLAASSKGWIE
jgi:hypothetical protein